MPKTKILYLISSLAQGGAERHLLELVRRLDGARYDADLCVLRDLVHFQGDLPEGQPRYPLHGRLWYSPAAFARLVGVLRAAAPDVVHTYLNDGNLWGRLAAPLAARGPGRPRLVTSVHLDDMSAAYRFVERRLWRRSDRIVAHSLSIARLLTGTLGVDPARVVVIANGVDPQRFQPASAEQRRAARAGFDLGAGDFVAVMPARIDPQKNHDLVVAALAALKAQGALPEGLRLLAAGRVSLPAYARQVEAAVAAAGLGPQVRFLGAVRDMAALYAAADVVLMPSRTEASPIAALEALACGVPVLISAASNTDEVLVPGRHGWQIDLPSAQSIAAALREILAADPAARREMGARARDHVVQRFTTSRVADDFMRLYEALRPS